MSDSVLEIGGDDNALQMSSVGTEIVEISGGVVDTTVRPSRESLRKELDKRRAKSPHTPPTPDQPEG